jgi:hypothetical protein
MKNLFLAWTRNNEGGRVDKVSWPDIAEALQYVKNGEGTITLDLEDDDGRQRSLQVQYESEKYLITLGMETNSDWIVKGYRDINASTENVLILGDSWRGDNICYDAKRIHIAFEQFFNTGDVSDDVWVA